MGKITKILTWAIAVLILVAGIGLIIKFTNGLTEDFTTFYVNIDGKDITYEAKGYEIPLGGKEEIEVKYLLNNVGAEIMGYSVKVLPTTDESKDFIYISDNLAYKFESEEDLTAGFNITENESSFTISPKGNLTEILKAVRGKDITHCDGQFFQDMFVLVVTSKDGKQSVKIHFTVSESIEGVKLNATEIVL